MRSIPKPLGANFETSNVLQKCTNEISEQILKDAFNNSRAVILNAAQQYDRAGEQAALVNVLPDNRSKESICLNGLTKEQFSKLYSNQMVKKEVPRREVYDQLKNRAPYGKCPFCGYCDVDQLDHYLPKSKYPLLTILPLNLVPSCPYCNGGKNAEIATTPEEQILHPYYDHGIIMGHQWIFATVVETKPAALKYFVLVPDHFDPIAAKRAATHFKKNNLGGRYSTQAADQISTFPLVLEDFFTNGGAANVKKNLFIQYQAEYAKYKNSWQTAMYQALSDSDWYCSGGFR